MVHTEAKVVTADGPPDVDQQRWAYALALAPDGGLKLQGLSDSFTAITGHDAAAVHPARAWASLVIAHHQPRYQRHLQALEAGEASRAEYCIRTSGGRLCSVLDEAEPLLRPDGGEPLCIMGMVHVVEADRGPLSALEERYHRLRTLTDALPVLVSYVDAEERYQHNNAAYEKWFGRRREELRGRTVREVLGEAAYATVAPHIRAALSGKHVRFIDDLPYKDAGVRKVAVDYVPDRAPDGSVKGFSALIQDISEPTRLASELERSLATLSHVEELARVGSYELVAPFGANDVHWADETFRIAGWPRERGAPSYQQFVELVHPEDRAAVQTQFMQTVSEGRPFDLEYRLRRPDGTLVYVQSVAQPVRSPDGQVRVVAGAMLDITARKLAEAVLREREGRLRAILETAADGIITVDRNRRIESLNPAARAMFTCTEEEVRGHPLSSLFPPSLQAPDGRRWLEQLRPSVPGIPYAVVGQRRNGQTFPVDLGVGVGAHNGGHVSLIVRDATERRRMEQELRRARTLEVGSTLASGVAHDFNNLLMGIIGCAELALPLVPPDHPAHSYVQEIRNAAVGGASIVRQLSSVRGRGPAQWAVSDLNDDIRQVENVLRGAVGEDVTVRFAPSSGTLPVRSDRGAMAQVLMNLALNARRAMPRGGLLELRTQRVVLDDEKAAGFPGLKAGPHARLDVSDTGEGMDAETLARVFEPFFTTRGQSGGTGLGLFMVYGVVRDHAGHVALRSQPGRGTTVTIHLPLASAPITASTAPSALPRDHVATGKALILEDERLVRMAARHDLEQLGWTVVEAADGPTAREIMRREGAGIRLLLSDVTLPGPSGPVIARELQAAYPSLAVVFMSAHPADVLEARGQLDPGSILLAKPITMTALDEATQSALLRIPSPRALRVLLVEDDRLSQLVFRTSLAQQGYLVTTASDCETARKHAASGGWDILVSDVGLPDCDGRALADELRRANPKLLVLYVSGHPPPGDSAMEGGAAWLQKPVSPDRILAQLEQLRARQR